MKRWGWLVVLTVASTPAWCGAKKITVAELKETLVTMHKQNKSDAEVAAALKQVELSEQLTRTAMNSLVEDVPGKESDRADLCSRGAKCDFATSGGGYSDSTCTRCG